MVNSNTYHNHEWECTDIPGIFNCLSCEDTRIFNYQNQEYRIYAAEGSS